MNTTTTSKKTTNKWHWGWSAFLIPLVIITGVIRFTIPLRGGDTWWHLLYGRFFIENLTLIPDHTIFSWTPTTNETIYCAWLPEVFLYLLYQLGEIPALITFRYLVVFFFIFAVWNYAYRNQIHTHPLTWLIALNGIFMSYVAIFAKPEIFSYVFFTLMAWNWWYIRSESSNAIKKCYLFPLILLVWVNSHGVFVFGMIFFTLCIVGEILNGLISRDNMLADKIRKHLFISYVMSCIALFVNPYGYKYLFQLFYSLIPNEQNIAYMKPIAAHFSPFSNIGITKALSYADYANVAIIILLFLLVAAFKVRKIDWSLLLTNLAFAFLYTRYIRTTFYWAPIFTFSSLYLLSQKPLLFFPKKNLYKTGLFIAVSLAAVFLSIHTIYDSKCRPEMFLWQGYGISETQPVESVLFIKNNYPNVTIGNTYNTGALLLWNVWPQNKVFIDSRHFPYRAWSQALFDFEQAKNVEEFIGKYPSDIWCVDLWKTRLIQWFTKDPDWRLAFYGKNAAVFVNNKLPFKRGLPRRGTEVDKFKSTTTGLTLLNFTTDIQDWHTTQRIVDRFNNHFACADAKKIGVFGQHFHDGLKAYHNKDFETAATQLIAARKYKYIKNDAALAFSLLRLASKAWQEKEFEKALTLCEDAHQLHPKNVYTIYNLGVISWYLSRNLALQPNKLEPWRNYLVSFIENTPSDPKFNNYILIAQNIINNMYPTMPKLMMPDEPQKRRPFQF